ncbi:unnamed protein product [Coregonus sp. 'balchen']|nr:unnamed protein product [Coregonus sp. 'balchen']
MEKSVGDFLAVACLRRETRLRREYLYRKTQEDRVRMIEEKKQKLKSALDGVSSHMDDEYKWAGVEDLKVMVTTSRHPSSRLKMFVKEVKLIFPGAQRMNRGGHEIKAPHKCLKRTVDELSHLPTRRILYLSVYMIKLGTLENEATADVECRHHSYTHTAKKRKFLSMA